MVDVEPIFADEKLIGSMSARSSWQPDVQLEDDEPTFDVMEEVGYWDSYLSWTGKEVNIPRTPNRLNHEKSQRLLRETLNELQERQYVLEQLIARKRIQDFGGDSSQSTSTWFPRWISKLAPRD